MIANIFISSNVTCSHMHEKLNVPTDGSKLHGSM